MFVAGGGGGTLTSKVRDQKFVSFVNMDYIHIKYMDTNMYNIEWC